MSTAEQGDKQAEAGDSLQMSPLMTSMAAAIVTTRGLPAGERADAVKDWKEAEGKAYVGKDVTVRACTSQGTLQAMVRAINLPEGQVVPTETLSAEEVMGRIGWVSIGGIGNELGRVGVVRPNADGYEEELTIEGLFGWDEAAQSLRQNAEIQIMPAAA